MSSLATSTGTQQILSVKPLYWPRYGSWRLDVVLADGDPPTAGEQVTATIGDLVIVGKIKRSGLDAVSKPHAIVVGGLGWHSNVTSPVSFQSDSGVRLSTVLAALSKGSGEPIEQPSDRTIGEYYECCASRLGEPVTWADALNDLARSGCCPSWRVDPDGVTRFGARPATAVQGRATQLAPSHGVGVIAYGLDDPSEWLPGHTVNGLPIDRLELRESAGKIQADIYTEESSEPTRNMVRRMIAEELGQREMRSYIVSVCHSDGRCDLVPPPDAPHLPEMRNVEQWIMGAVMYVAAEGDEVMVTFRDRRKTRPAIIGYKLRGSDYRGMARLNDATMTYLPTRGGQVVLGLSAAALAQLAGYFNCASPGSPLVVGAGTAAATAGVIAGYGGAPLALVSLNYLQGTGHVPSSPGISGTPGLPGGKLAGNIATASKRAKGSGT